MCLHCSYIRREPKQYNHYLIIFDKMNCTVCNVIVIDSHHAVRCDGCEVWTHIQCDTGITESRYRSMVRGEVQLLWKCIPCRRITNERTAVSYGPHTINTDIIEPDIRNPINVPQAIDENLPIVYNLVQNSSNKGTNLIADNRGYTYFIKKDNTRNTIHWRCRYSGGPIFCKYKLKQVDVNSLTLTTDTLVPITIRNPHSHTCTPVIG